MTPASWGLLAVFCSSPPVFYRLWRDNRQTSLAHAVAWALFAWLTWILTLPLEPIGTKPGPWIYLALALTGCASIAVLGARRPGVTMWNAVVVAFLAMELLPWGEALVRQDDFHCDGLRMATLIGAVTIGVMNYLPTRAFQGALLVGLACVCEYIRFLNAGEGANLGLDMIARCALAAAPGAVLLCRSPAQLGKRNDFDRCWIVFRDRFGVIWGQRLREQFNQAARHAQWPVTLTWQGLRTQTAAEQPNQEQQQAMVQTLQALMKRFGDSNKG